MFDAVRTVLCMTLIASLGCVGCESHDAERPDPSPGHLTEPATLPSVAGDGLERSALEKADDSDARKEAKAAGGAPDEDAPEVAAIDGERALAKAPEGGAEDGTVLPALKPSEDKAFAGESTGAASSDVVGLPSADFGSVGKGLGTKGKGAKLGKAMGSSGGAYGMGGLGGRGVGRGGGGTGFGRVHGMGKVDTGGGVSFGASSRSTGRFKGDGGVAARRGELGGKKAVAAKAAPVKTEAVEPHPRSPARETAGKRPSADRLTAGEWRDLDHWAFWQELFQGEGGERWTQLVKPWGVAPRGRVPVTVRHQGRPVVDAEVELRDGRQRALWHARTDSKGRAELFADGAKGKLSVVVRSGDAQVTVGEVAVGRKEPVRVVLSDAKVAANQLDVMFMVDTTGSMGDELNYLKQELGAVLGRVQETNGEQLKLRTSVNFYRDEGDVYTVRPFGFTTRTKQSIRQIRQQSAGGGGDFPEAVDKALDNGIDQHKWSTSARGRVMFLVMDAPPHGNPKVSKSVQRSVRQAARKGVRIVPVVGSGVDKDTEFLMRSVSIRTGGTYVFLTDHSGIGGKHMKPTIGPHKVELLSAVLERLINEAATGQ
ncbi:MAG: VWA domain-containing protein [Myxococcota bacterium]